MKLALITRCRNEPFLDEFVDHYINEGVDAIYIIDDRSRRETYQNVIHCSRVHIIRDIPFLGDWSGSELSELFTRIKNKFDWIVNVDVDEFITTKRNSGKTLRDELQTTFNEVDCILVPWVMMSFNGIEANPECLLQTNIYRWNHDKRRNHLPRLGKFRCRFDEIEVKSIFKTKSFEGVWDHGPIAKKPESIKAVDSIDKKEISIHSDTHLSNPFYRNLREESIARAFLLCYHYRAFSKQHCREKLIGNNFPDYSSYAANDFIETDFPEVIDPSLCLKSQSRPNFVQIIP